MKYQSGQRRKAIEYEKAIAKWWKKNRTFEKSVEERPIDNSYVFYDGPPFLTGLPHHGHLLGSTIKDAVGRYQTMNGKHVERVWGWDCHGLPAENYVEKQLGITDRRDIGTKWSLEDYILTAKKSMEDISDEWEHTITRIGRWVDFKGAYRTMDKNFMESVWWAFKKLCVAGKIYEGRKVLMYDTKFATPVSKAEVTMDNDAYQTVTDPSAYVKFKLCKKAKSYLMGVGDIADRLAALHIEYTKDEDNYLVTLDPSQLDAYEKLVDEALKLTYWNEYIYRGEAHFTFKDASGKLQKFVWRPGDDETQILKLCREYAKTEFENIEKMITDNDFYRDVFEKTYFLAWTTTPWTLMANRALAVSPDLDYVKVKVGDEVFIIAEPRLGKVLSGGQNTSSEGPKTWASAPERPEEEVSGQAPTAEPTVLEHIKGSDLAGLSYESIDGTICQVFTADFVGAEEGTGIVHIAPAYGEDDYNLYLAHQDEMDFVDTLDENGYYIPEYADKLHALGVRDTDEHGIQIWVGNKFIAKCLEEKGIIYKIEYIQHEYPFNPRSKERIMYRAFPSWFFDIEGQKPLMLAENENINWFPGYLKHGRFAKNIEAAPDWNLSRDRFWATAMPVWKGEKTGAIKVFGSYEELKEYSGKELDDYHRPWVDEIEFDAYVDHGRVTALEGDTQLSHSEDGGGKAGRTRPGQDPSDVLDHFTRIDKVLDCWFESGSMPFAQLHYPFENKEKFEQNYPADFIVEYVGQVRAWFYYVHAVNTALAEIGAFGDKAKKGHKNAYKNVITTGTIAGNDGRKMSKSIGNFTDPNILMDQYSADALRFLLLSSPVCSGEDFALLDKDVSDVHRKLSMLWNVYDFFTTYAEIEGLSSEELSSASATALDNPLDNWIIERFYELRDAITTGMKEYNIPKALEPVLPFIDDLSNWYVRRSRRRFSKNDDREDKLAAFSTLYEMLRLTAIVLAPFTPFLSEELYQKLTGTGDSVHLLYWPAPLEGKSHGHLLEDMSRTRAIITDALALRMRKSDTEAQIKVRQPLASLTYPGDKLDDFYEQIIADEVNVKKVENGTELSLDKTLTPDLLEEGFARDLIRAVQATRKAAGLKPDDHIRLSLSCDIPARFIDLVKSEAKADTLEQNANYAFDQIAKVGEDNITISLEKS